MSARLSPVPEPSPSRVPESIIDCNKAINPMPPRCQQGSLPNPNNTSDSNSNTSCQGQPYGANLANPADPVNPPSNPATPPANLVSLPGTSPAIPANQLTLTTLQLTYQLTRPMISLEHSPCSPAQSRPHVWLHTNTPKSMNPICLTLKP